MSLLESARLQRLKEDFQPVAGKLRRIMDNFFVPVGIMPLHPDIASQLGVQASCAFLLDIPKKLPKKDTPWLQGLIDQAHFPPETKRENMVFLMILCEDQKAPMHSLEQIHPYFAAVLKSDISAPVADLLTQAEAITYNTNASTKHLDAAYLARTEDRLLPGTGIFTITTGTAIEILSEVC